MATTTVIPTNSAHGRAVLALLPSGVDSSGVTITMKFVPTEEKKAEPPIEVAVVTQGSEADLALFIPQPFDVTKQIDNEPLNPAKTITGGKYIRDVLAMETGGSARNGAYNRYLAVAPYTADASQLLLLHRITKDNDRHVYQFRILDVAQRKILRKFSPSPAPLYHVTELGKFFMRMNHATNEIVIIRPQQDAPNVQVFDGTSGKKKRQFDIKISRFWNFVVANNTIFALSLDPVTPSPIHVFDFVKGDLIRQLSLPVEEGVKRTAMACIKQSDEKDEKAARDPLLIITTTNRIYVLNSSGTGNLLHVLSHTFGEIHDIDLFNGEFYVDSTRGHGDFEEVTAVNATTGVTRFVSKEKLSTRAPKSLLLPANGTMVFIKNYTGVAVGGSKHNKSFFSTIDLQFIEKPRRQRRPATGCCTIQ